MNIRRANVDDAEIIAEHRREMFADMGYSDNEQLERVRTELMAYLPSALAKEEYLGWLAEINGEIIAGVGLIFYDLLPHPKHLTTCRPYLLNAYTKPNYRRLGIMKKLVDQAIVWCKESGFSVILLHPSEVGEKLYLSLGFIHTKEMRLEL